MVYASLPPTSIDDTLIVGWPTVTGMPPETDPHIPAESFKSLPTISIFYTAAITLKINNKIQITQAAIINTIL